MHSANRYGTERVSPTENDIPIRAPNSVLSNAVVPVAEAVVINL